MYQALYRKWRPRTFDDVIGQGHISETLKRQVIGGRLSHAYLFVGTRGTGKTTCAKILSRAINCQRPEQGNPCNVCPSCAGILSGSVMDVVELDAASNNGVDSVRTLRDEAVYSPVDVKKRVYIIDEVHMLSTPAFNALLKILEEPPEHLIFILATTEVHKIPATILSRCQRFSFKRIPADDIARRLLAVAGFEDIALTEGAAALLSRLADGSLRDGLSLLDQCSAGGAVDEDRVLSAIGLIGMGDVSGLLAAISEDNAPEALTLLDRLYDGGKVMAFVVDELQTLVRDVLVTSLMPQGAAGLLSGMFGGGVLEDFSGRLAPERLLAILEALRQTQLDLAKGSGGKLAVELCLLRLCDSRLGTDPASLLGRLARLEARAEAGGPPPAPAAPVHTPPPDTPVHAPPPATPVYTPPPDAPVYTPPPDAPVHAPPPATPVYTPPPDTPVHAPPPATPVHIPPPDAPIHTPPPDTPVHTPPPADADAVWPGILERIRAKIDIPPYTFLCDPMHTSPRLDDAGLTISAKTPFVAQMVDAPPVAAAIREAAAELLGQPIRVRVVVEDAGPARVSEKLDALRRFSNITFE